MHSMDTKRLRGFGHVHSPNTAPRRTRPQMGTRRRVTRCLDYTHRNQPVIFQRGTLVYFVTHFFVLWLPCRASKINIHALGLLRGPLFFFCPLAQGSANHENQHPRHRSGAQLLRT